jgi:cytosine/adenosine deaminase-related metal-dependent hydrolase
LGGYACDWRANTEEAQVDRWLLHDVRVLDQAGSFTEPVDVTVSDGVITGVGPNLTDAEAAVADLAGCKALDLKARIGDAVRIAKAHGVKIALGCDYYLFRQHGRNLEEISLLHRAGLTVEEALLAATLGGAQLCGVSGKLGRIQPGYVFDAIVLDQDPGDPVIFEQPGAVAGVFKAGVPVVSHPRVPVPG